MDKKMIKLMGGLVNGQMDQKFKVIILSCEVSSEKVWATV